eukprot:scaffold37502_cov51-Phaeocystis_antarctica.AAC.2
MREEWWPRAWCALAALVAAPEKAAAEPYLLYSYTAGGCACAGEPRCAAAAAGRVHVGREGLLHGGERDPGGKRQARARPAGRGEGARLWRE